MKFADMLKTPELFFNPKQLVRYQLMKKGNISNNEFEEVSLPWGVKILVRPHEFIGKRICMYGLYDLCVCESVWNLLDPGECAVDVGANIGQMASLMAVKCGGSGKVIAFEPHPKVYEELMKNVNTWNQKEGLARIISHQVALSENAGEGLLRSHATFQISMGRSRVVTEENYQALEGRDYKIKLQKLDEIIDNHEKIGVMKIDVEGHEISVLKGAKEVIESNRIRDIIFEEHAKYPTVLTQFLEEYGYSLFYLEKSFWGIEVGEIKNRPQYTYTIHEVPNYLATKEPERALVRLRKKGWRVLLGW
ncbi:FkbM family methyltransferase [Microseira wollei]|uniref:Methyltransferase FkbM domain-containing protein n=1 Tax=Microseira wollei NIES-4236 TaxID=2530354 RepID=A0AAV3XKJ9_9CYAN|nr:FkbM family methyltransferase [Microseira wollei]GET43193.1 hypothetical protein MiSe_80150 [Microseira wollei NIES-4236]